MSRERDFLINACPTKLNHKSNFLWVTSDSKFQNLYILKIAHKIQVGRRQLVHRGVAQN